MTRWTPAAMPDLTGRTAVVTGANSGIGLPTALELARHGARVIATARTPDKGAETVRRILREVPDAWVEPGLLDLADLASVRRFAAGVTEVDLLVNNAGIAMVARQLTRDGFELQLGTNHLGHFALTGLLLPLLAARPGARVVTVSSDAHAAGRFDFDDLGLERGYGRMSAYARSKLANLLFTLELQRRAGRAGVDLKSVAVHPGTTATNIVKVGPLQPLVRLLLKSAAAGAVPSLYAAVSPDVRGGEYFGPGAKLLRPSRAAHSEELAARLWEVSAELTGVRFEQLAHEAPADPDR
ncbi:NAD(P)-dependent dehydrogenase (short-subunit alcohol dehydrogenase family) [Nonomuraea thailandensis]|uniref:NAD(P)-dependent dehydrogenase (Short-subunit alcohol dehydrogenase family) n=1 Tax=Nonomuraea thailandensis TaxID=1188745 RepID=A0A9X2GA44_9ACTN|nr:oxidoreductase [Nonomuraea thailandensis]MCP2355217.1 NAD(P)-dependent dehydrogenase (short-subunit alcohol dehydrogenase family) [Nonomuraea thailandensis]